MRVVVDVFLFFSIRIFGEWFKNIQWEVEGEKKLQ